MSAIMFEWTPAETDAPTNRSLKVTPTCCRKEEFRVALDHYTAEYIIQQVRRAGRSKMRIPG